MEVLNYRLVLASLKKADLPLTMHALTRLAFFPRSDEDAHFFSFTETPREISLILDADSIQAFPEGLLMVQPTVWRCLEVYPGESGIGMQEFTKTVHKIAAPLAQAGISIFQVSTFASDFTLVAEDKLQQALDCLRPYFNLVSTSGFGVDIRDARQEFAAMEQRQVSESISLPNASPLLGTDTSVTAPKQPHPFSFPIQQRLYICTLRDQHMLAHLLKPLLKQLFYAPYSENTITSTRFFSFTVADGQSSFLMDQKALNDFPSGCFNVLDLGSPNTTTNIIEVVANSQSQQLQSQDETAPNKPNHGLGFEETGIVASFTAPLAQAGINCFYLSTFLSDFVLVGDFDRAVAVLRSENYPCLGTSV